MKPLSSVIALLFVCVFAHAEEDGFHVFEAKGYTDTELIPGDIFRVHQDDRPSPPRVTVSPAPEEPAPPPSDAIVLFDGSTLDQFQEAEWELEDGIVTAGEGNLTTRDAFGDCQLHVEWRAPNPPSGPPTSMGNSGILFMQLYEVQIYDSYSSRIYADGSAAAIYGQTPPLVNACRRPGEWQTYDIIFTAPVFEGDQLAKRGTVTMLHNGVLVHSNTEILGAVAHAAPPTQVTHGPRLPLLIQGHGSPVEFRSIWIRDLDPGV